MAKSEKQASSNAGSINRKRKNSFERKCISKATKRLFKDLPPSLWRTIDKLEKAARKLERGVMSYDIKPGGKR